MQPLHQLLHRIRWDPEFGNGEFALGYTDRVLREEVVLPFASLRFDAQPHGTFTVTDLDGVDHRIPLHRVRTVYKNGTAIWQRPAAPRT